MPEDRLLICLFRHPRQPWKSHLFACFTLAFFLGLGPHPALPATATARILSVVSRFLPCGSGRRVSSRMLREAGRSTSTANGSPLVTGHRSPSLSSKAPGTTHTAALESSV
eukprot:scaffold10644_cov107-Isochrysis_galbana.AAC.6